MKSLRNSFLLVIGLVVIVGSFYLVLSQPAPAKYQAQTLPHTLKIGETSINIEIADTPEERQQGLSGRQNLPPQTGLLFIFEKVGKPGFWMKDMNFPIDIVWISDDFRVVDLDKDVSPETFPKIFAPRQAVKYVLEVPAGFSQETGLDIGTIIHME